MRNRENEPRHLLLNGFSGQFTWPICFRVNYFRKKVALEYSKIIEIAAKACKSGYHFGEVRSAFMLPPDCLFPNIHWLDYR